MDIHKSRAQMRKSILEYCVLLTLENKEMYVSDIINVLKKSEIIVVEGTLYPLLSRLKTAGYLKYRWEESKQGPPRKYYSLGNKGREFLKLLDQSWHELQNSINEIKKQNN